MKLGAPRLILAAGLAVATPVQADDCPTTGTETAVVASVDPRLELRLDDGRRLRLAGLDPALQTPADPDLAETVRQRLAALVAGKPVSIRVLASSADRWGRVPAQVFSTGAAEPGGLAAAALKAGLGRYLAEPAGHACRDTFLSAEGAAREAKLGLWADPYYAVLAVDDQAAFSERSGTMVVVEGRLASVEPGPFRTKLRFTAPGSYGRRLLAATILPRVMKAFEAKGVTFQPLIGSTLRLRGLLDLQFGPQIELAGPDDIEVVRAPVN